MEKYNTKLTDEVRKFEATITNTGDKIVDAKVSLSIANVITAQEENFPKKNYTIYPGQTLTVYLSLPKKLESGKYALAAIMDYGHRKSLEGVQLVIDEN